jgi:hypothetical protein
VFRRFRGQKIFSPLFRFVRFVGFVVPQSSIFPLPETLRALRPSAFRFTSSLIPHPSVFHSPHPSTPAQRPLAAFAPPRFKFSFPTTASAAPHALGDKWADKAGSALPDFQTFDFQTFDFLSPIHGTPILSHLTPRNPPICLHPSQILMINLSPTPAIPPPPHRRSNFTNP